MRQNVAKWWWAIISLIPMPCFAHNIFASGWGLKFANSPEGILVDAVCKLMGVIVMAKCGLEIWGKAMNPGNHSYYKAIIWFISGTIFYYAPEFVNLAYNSIWLT